jgi:hypothetical protein
MAKKRRIWLKWMKLIQTYEGSGLTHEEFAESLGVDVLTFRSNPFGGFNYRPLAKSGGEEAPRIQKPRSRNC